MWLLPPGRRKRDEREDRYFYVLAASSILPAAFFFFLNVLCSTALLSLCIEFGSYSIVHKEQRGTVLLLTR